MLISEENKFFWEIFGNGLVMLSYFYGIIYMIFFDDYFFMDGIKFVFEKSMCVVFEIDIEEMMNFVVMMGLLG